MNKLTQDEFLKRAKEVHGDKYDYSLALYTGCKNKLKIICKKCGVVFEQAADNHIRNRGCPNCKFDLMWSKRKDRQTKETFIEKSNLIHKNKYNYSLVEWKTVDDKVKIICNECGNVFEQVAYQHLVGHGCPNCATNKNSSKRRLTQDEFLKRAKEVHGDKYDYSITEYKGRNKKIKIICKNCNKIFEQNAGNHLCGRGCPNCRASIGEEIIKNYLEKNNIAFTKQKTYKELFTKKANCKLKYDFYLPEYNLLIEYNGRQHYEWVKTFNKTYKDLLYSRHRDWLKRKYARDNNINFLAIPYWELDNIEKILIDEII